MAASANFTVTPSTPVVLATGLKHVLIANMGPYPLFIGGSGVSDTNGFPVPANGSATEVPIGLGTLESIYGITQSGDSDVRVLTTNL